MIETRIEGIRGCGRRKPGGLYLVSPALSEPCPRLPLALDRCPHCGQGIGPARGWTWVEPATVAPAKEHSPLSHNAHCPLGVPASAHEYGKVHEHRMGDRAGLIWVGEKFYPTPEAFMAEAAAMGVSRRIKALPRGFEIGKDWVLLGHRKAIDHSRYATAEELAGELPLPSLTYTVISSPTDAIRILDDRPYDERYSPGIITLFRPTAVEYVIKGDETDEEIESLEKRGIQPVEVMAGFRFEIVEDATGEVVRQGRVASAREAGKMADGAEINLNHDRYSVRVVSV